MHQIPRHQTVWLLVLALLLAANQAAGDVFRPAYLEMQQIDAETYAVRWRVPIPASPERAGLMPVWPASVTSVSESRTVRKNGGWESRFTVHAAGGLIDQEVSIPDLRGRVTDVIVRIERADGTTQIERLMPSQARFTVIASPGAGEIAWDYLVLGVEHILGGLDHLLFVLALMLLVKDLRRLIWTITGFTLAHSFTLILATLGLIRVPSAPVEACIALSIVFVAAEVVNAQNGKTSISVRSPWIVAFAFGLLHGLGFAGALREVGLPETAVAVALLMFNVGVEVGQLLFVTALAMSAIVLRRLTGVYVDQLSRGVGYLIGTIAAFWTIERIVAFTT